MRIQTDFGLLRIKADGRKNAIGAGGLCRYWPIA